MGSSDTLRSVIDAGRSSKRLDELSSARVVGKIALQIHAAQQKAGAGKAVGPITPAHIKLAPSGDAKLEISEGVSLGYTSPEQTMGSFGDRRSDVFSLGTVLWEALTYNRLFDAMNDAAVRMAVQERAIQPPSEINANVPAELSAICMRALARNPTDRYQSLKSMAVEIEEFLQEAGYADDDTKIAAHLATLHEPQQQVKITMAPLARPATSTQPPPTQATADKQASGTQPPPNVLKQPSAPAMLRDAAKPEPRPKSPSGAALAAALANASTAATTSNGATATPTANPATTLVGIPSAAHEPAGLPTGSTPLRNDKSTISVAVPPQVKVSTVEAKHVEAKAQSVEDKPTAQVVEDKPNAQVVEDTPKAQSVAVDTEQNAKATVVDTKRPEHEVPKLVDAKLPEDPHDKPTMKQSAIETQAITALAPNEATPSQPEASRAPSQSEASRAPSQSEASRAPSQSEASRAPSQSEATTTRRPRSPSAHPAAAVALGAIPAGKESKDLLGGWGWGTDKHNAIAPEGYADDDYEIPAPNTKKTLTYVIGGGFALAAIATILAVGFGGSSSPKKKPTAAVAATSPSLVDPAPPAAPTAPPAPETTAATPGNTDPAQAAGATPGSADSAQSEAEAAKLAAAQAEAAKAEAAKTEAAKAEQAKADAEAAKVEAARLASEQANAKQTEAARIAAEKAAAKQAEQAKAGAAKTEAARIAAEKAEAKKTEAARIAAEKAEAKKAQQAKAEVAKAEAARIAAEKAEAKKAEAAKRAEVAKTQPKTTPKKVETRVAKAEPAKAEAKPDGKIEFEAAYRNGLQMFARGDTTGALASLRTSLAGNPSYAPTWRGLGLVFEKMGEKDQARAAFRRYLQLAPTAADTEQIRGRLERLGS